MAASITSTIGGASSNSYLTVSEGTTLSEALLGTLVWTTATTDQRTRALIMAARYLDELDWVGERATITQSLAWPRKDAECGEKSYTASEIPGEITQAQFDIAEALLGDATLLSGTGKLDGELITGIPNSALKSARIDVLSVDFRETLPAASRNVLNALPHLKGLLGCLCLSGPASAYGTVRIVRA